MSEAALLGLSYDTFKRLVREVHKVKRAREQISDVVTLSRASGDPART